MAITAGFRDGTTGYSAATFAAFYERLFENGVSTDADGSPTLKVTADGGTVKVAPGAAYAKGFWLQSDSIITLTPTKPGTGSMIYRVIARVDVSGTGSADTIALKQGTASAPPDLVTTGSTYELSLAKVTITSAGAITVVDERANQTVCGLLRPKNLAGMTEMLESMQAQFDAMYSSMQSQEGVRKIYIQETAPTDAVEGSIWI
ncbi:hypothetical protein SAMN04515656_104150 [Eubacterium aggregans]|uniref:Uncharacterized protein n=1 Tax=Eubacterium aggregans TaxID=81409 RepID=A0A1H3YXD2_9FIRM|nr:hypothetical protein [Eubacterium aggregans]SEA16067.1 hypothetical protein SAMN04515656_104150 [Eubacterium aggregans]